MVMRIIASEADLAEGLDALVRRDRRLRKVVRVAGQVPLRRRPAGFAGLARIVVGQQLSIASAEAIWRRLLGAFPDCAAEAIHAAPDEALRAVGLSAAKIRTLRATAAACRDGFDLCGLADLPADDARRRLTEVKGIGPWTADVYLLFCLGHADIFPAGDLALRNAVADALGLAPPLSIDEAADIAVRWSPWRGVAACLFWAYYRVRRQRKAVPV
jgi:DNA-3-methyladenine glycosylase II